VKARTGRTVTLLFGLAMLARAGCGEEGVERPGKGTPSGPEAGAESRDAAAVDGGAGETDEARQQRLDELEAFYQLMKVNALGFDLADGDWTEDLGDAPFYGTGFYARMAQESGDEEARLIAEAARDYNIFVLQDAAGDINFFLANLEEVIMAALGLIEYADATGDSGFVAEIDRIIDTTNTALLVFGDYLQDTGIDSWALQVYGPTAITAALALLNLQYAIYLDTDLEQDRIDRAAEIIAAIDANALETDGSGGERYLFQAGVTDLYLYPNAMMILVLNRQYEITGLPGPLTRAEKVFGAIQPLKDEERGGYNSPYSAADMGATTDDYATLSSQNYLLLALSILYRNTGDERYIDEALDVFDFIRTRLYDETEGVILHHWIDGRPALPEDPEYFCSGCNLQFLYVTWFFFNSVSG
jgi:hypothetical protein